MSELTRVELSVLEDLWNGDLTLTAEQRTWIRQALDAQESAVVPPTLGGAWLTRLDALVSRVEQTAESGMRHPAIEALRDFVDGWRSGAESARSVPPASDAPNEASYNALTRAALTLTKLRDRADRECWDETVQRQLESVEAQVHFARHPGPRVASGPH